MVSVLNIYAGLNLGPVTYMLNLQLSMQSVPITTKVESSNPAHGEVYSIQHYEINLWLVGAFLRVRRFPPPIKLVTTL